MKMVQGWRAGLVGLGERTPEPTASMGDFGSSVAVFSAVDLFGSGVLVAGVEVSGRVGVEEALVISGVFPPDLLSLLGSRFLSFLGPCFSFSLSA